LIIFFIIEGRTQTWKDLLYESLLKQGCVYEEREGRERPGWFDTDSYNFFGRKKHSYQDYLNFDHSFELNLQSKQWQSIRDECLSCRRNVVVFNMSSMGKILVSGNDAEEAIEWLCTSDIKSVPNGSTVYTCLLNSLGGVESDLNVSKIDSNNYYITCWGFATNHTLSHISSVINEKNFKSIEVKNVTSDYGILSIQGPNSARLISDELRVVGLAHFPFSTHSEFDINGDLALARVRI
jgi:sarcosine dehydrogenase